MVEPQSWLLQPYLHWEGSFSRGVEGEEYLVEGGSYD